MTEGPTVRVRQLAMAMGATLTEALERLRDVGVNAQTPTDRITWAQAAAALDGVTPAGDLSVARQLLLRAFEAARSSGRNDWDRTTPAVLKNRLLDQTHKAFRETDYGAPSFGYFVSMFPDLIAVELVEGRQPILRIREEALSDLERLPSYRIRPPAYVRLRPDLWKAFCDFRSGRTYVWNVGLSVAEEGQPGEGRILIPTLTAVEETSWREHFQSNIEGDLSPEEQTALAEWVTKRLPTVTLPVQVRGPWNGYLRDRVIEKIQQFFDENQAVPPPHIVERADAPRHERSSEVNRLRTFVQRCVAEMSQEELSALLLPAGVVARVHPSSQAQS